MEVSHGEATETIRASTLLEHVSSDCLALICQRMPFKYLQALKQCGNRTLTMKLERGVTEIVANLKALSKWPISVFQHSNLRSLIVNPQKESSSQTYVPIIAAGDVLVPHTGHQTLERLELNLTHGFTLLNPVRARPPLATLVPNLKTLKIEGDGQIHSGTLENTAWPRGLTSLTLMPFAFSGGFNFSLFSLSKLPSSLELLHIEYIRFERPAKALEPKIFPPALTSIDIICEGYDELIAVLPTSLRKIGLTLFDANCSLRVSSLSRFENLTDLSLTFTQATLGRPAFTADAPFPATLTSLETQTTAKLVVETGSLTHANLVLTLPPSITRLQGFSSHHESIDWSSAFPLLKTLPKGLIPALIYSKTKFPPLTSLDVKTFRLPAKCVAALPDTLTELLAVVQDTPEWLESIAKMTQLKTLEMSPESGTMPSHGFWNIIRERVSRLHVELHQFESLDGLFGDWKNLSDLTLRARTPGLSPKLQAELDSYDPSSHGYRYPTSLTSCTLIMSFHPSLFAPSLHYLPKLRELSLFYITQASQDFMKDDPARDTWDTLPSSLRRFELLALHGIPARYLRNLPKNLRELKITVDSSKSDFVWTEEHLRHLPSSLTSCHLRGSHLEGAVNVRLPSRLTFFDISYASVGQATLSMIEAQRQRKLILPNTAH